MANYTKVWRVPTYRGVANASASVTLPANICLVLDATNGQVGGLPAGLIPVGASTPTALLGCTPAAIPPGKKGDVACMDGDVVVLKADTASGGGNVSIGSRLTISTDAAHLGYVKVDASADVLKVGYALEATSTDGTLIYVVLAPKVAEA